MTTVYRGVDEAQLSLPEHFYMKTFDNRGIPGGAEKAFMSATTDREVAYQYAGGNSMAGTIMEIEFDAASRGVTCSSSRARRTRRSGSCRPSR